MSRHLRTLRQSGLIEESHPGVRRPRAHLQPAPGADGEAQALAGGDRAAVVGAAARLQGASRAATAMSSRILVALRVAATPARAFEVFTARDRPWWRPNRLFQFTRGAPGRSPSSPARAAASSRPRPTARSSRSAASPPGSPAPASPSPGARRASRPGQVTEVEIRFEAVGERDPGHRRASRLGDGAAGARRPPHLSRRACSCSATANGGRRC